MLFKELRGRREELKDGETLFAERARLCALRGIFCVGCVRDVLDVGGRGLERGGDGAAVRAVDGDVGGHAWWDGIGGGCSVRSRVGWSGGTRSKNNQDGLGFLPQMPGDLRSGTAAVHATPPDPRGPLGKVRGHPSHATTARSGRSVRGETHLSRRQRQRVASARRDRQRSAPRCRKRARGARSGSRRRRRAARERGRRRSRASETNDEASLSSRESAEASAEASVRYSGVEERWIRATSQIYQKTYLVIRWITRYAYKYIHIYLTQLAQNTTQLDQDRDCRDAQDDVEEEVRGHRLAWGTAEADGLAQELLLHRVGHLAGLALGRSGRGLRLLSLRRERVGAGTVRRSEHSTETVVEISLGWIRGDTAAWRW